MKSLTMISVFIFLSFVSLFGFQAVLAQDFPTKPVTLVIPVGAGGSHDLTARAVASVANDYLGQPIIIQLKPGGGGAIGSELVAKAARMDTHCSLAAPDGAQPFLLLRTVPKVLMIWWPYAGLITVRPS